MPGTRLTCSSEALTLPGCAKVRLVGAGLFGGLCHCWLSVRVYSLERQVGAPQFVVAMRASNLARPAPPAGAGCSLLPAGGLQAAAAWSTPSTCARRLLCCPRPPAAASGAARATRCSAFPHGEPQQLACGLQQRMGRAGSAWRPQRSSSIVRSTSTDSSSSSTGRFAGWVVPPLQHLVKQDDEAGRGSGQGQAGGPDAEYDEDYTWAGDAELDVVDGAEGRQPHAQAVDATSLLEGVMEAERAVAGIMQGVYLGEALAKRKGGSRSSGMAAGDSGQGAAASAAGGAPVAPPHFVGAVQVEDIPGGCCKPCHTGRVGWASASSTLCMERA